MPIFYKFSLLQAAAATVNSDESTSKRGRSKVKNPSKFPKLQLLKPDFVSSIVSLAAELKNVCCPVYQDVKDFLSLRWLTLQAHLKTWPSPTEDAVPQR